MAPREMRSILSAERFPSACGERGQPARRDGGSIVWSMLAQVVPALHQARHRPQPLADRICSRSPTG